MLKYACDSNHGVRPAAKGLAFACSLAVIVLSGCASTQNSIDAAADRFRPQEREARQAMLAGRHAAADVLYAGASEQIDTVDETYVDGYFYLDQARMAGNRAFMALLEGNVGSARRYFSSSEEYLNSGVRDHKAVLDDREDTQQGLSTVVGIGAIFGMTALGINAADEATTYEQSQAALDATSQLMELTVDVMDLISTAIAEIHEIDVHEDAQHVDPDAWRAAVISDHPIPRAVVRVKTDNGRCTGFFIQPRLVATSAHCLDESNPGRIQVEVHDPRRKQEFLLGEPTARLTTKAVYWPPTYDWDTVCHRDDVALIVVGEDRPSEVWLTIDTQPVTTQRNAAVIGYSGDLDKGFFQRIDYGCKIEKNHITGQVANNCASYPGNSGGPVLSVDHGRATDPLRVAGVVSCGEIETAGTRTAELRKGAAAIGPLAELYRGVVARNPGLGDPGLFE